MTLRNVETRLFGSILLVALSGCAPSGFDRALQYSAEKQGVADAAARRTKAAAYLRFNAMLLSDIDDALADADDAQLPAVAATILRAAEKFAVESGTNEIDRLPPAARDELAKRAGTDATAAGLDQHLALVANESLDRELQEVESATPSRLRRKLRRIRRSVQPLPDDRGRLGRQIAYFWAALPSWIGLALQEDELDEKLVAKAHKRFERVEVFRPASSENDPLSRHAPIICVESPQERAYDSDLDRIGAVRLSESNGAIEVKIDPSQPSVYAYTAQAKVGQRRLRQFVYVWWFPDRPEMTKDDPAAGHIGGGTLRVTLDPAGTPCIVESTLNCGCGHQVFVSQDLEAAARREMGSPPPGRRFAVEKNIFGKHNVVVVHSFATGPGAARPTIYLAAGYHEVCQVRFAEPDPQQIELVKDTAYRIRRYEELDRLPLGDGIGSMFGSDGLVHNAGRPEGVLLAPTGILSAGQPRKRGTQRVRWDDFLFDDPRLLERTLRLPVSFFDGAGR